MEVISISFEGVGDSPFNTNSSFVKMIIDRMTKAMKFTRITAEDIAVWSNLDIYDEENAIAYLSEKISSLCQ